MKKNVYYRSVLARPNVLKKFLLYIFLGFSVYFRIPIETITRKNFGERYFNLMMSSIVGLFLLITPYYLCNRYGEVDTSMLLSKYATWYIYTVIYLYCLFKRRYEVKHEPSVYDFARFSLSQGTLNPVLLPKGLKDLDPRRIATLYEPGIFFVAGAILAVFTQPLGLLFMICSIVYSLGYMGAYDLGDDFIMDKIDEMICNEDLSETFMDGVASKKGVEFFGTRPDSLEMRQRLYDEMIEDDSKPDDENDVK